MHNGHFVILLVGEDSYNRQLLADILVQRGCLVKSARSAAEAEKALDDRPDLIVVDQKVRGTNGLTWIRRLRDRAFTMPIVFCSASNCSNKTFNVLRNLLGVSLIVRKPLFPQVLSNQIQALLPGEPDQAKAEQLDLTNDLHFGPQNDDKEQSWLNANDEEQETRAALVELGRTYLAEMPETLYELRAQIEAIMAAKNDGLMLEAAITTAHQIKGTAGSLGFPELSLLAASIESKLKDPRVSPTEVDGEKICVDPVAASEPLAQALVVVAEIESWLEDWQDDHEIWGTSPSVAWAKPEPPDFDEEADYSRNSKLKHAYIVDGNPIRAQFLADYLSQTGEWQVELLPVGVKVLTALEEAAADLVIIDSQGEELSGFDICRMIRCHPKWANLPVFILTEETGVESRQAIYNCGATDFVVKPVVEQELANRLSAVKLPAPLPMRA